MKISLLTGKMFDCWHLLSSKDMLRELVKQAFGASGKCSNIFCIASLRPAPAASIWTFEFNSADQSFFVIRRSWIRTFELLGERNRLVLLYYNWIKFCTSSFNWCVIQVKCCQSNATNDSINFNIYRENFKVKEIGNFEEKRASDSWKKDRNHEVENFGGKLIEKKRSELHLRNSVKCLKNNNRRESPISSKKSVS